MKSKKIFIILLSFIILPCALSGQNLTDAQGMKTGAWKVNYPDGTLRYEAVFEKGVPVGTMKRYDEKGMLVAKMNFLPNSTRCYAKLYRGNKQLKAEGLYISQRKDSVWVYYGKNDFINLKENYVNGIQKGITESYYASGKISQVFNFENGVKNGKWTQYFEDGNLMQTCTYKNDKLHGSYEAHFPEGRVEVKGNYVNNFKDGDWMYFSEEGEVKDILQYSNGDILNPETLQENYDEFIKHVEDNIGNIPDPDDGDF